MYSPISESDSSGDSDSMEREKKRKHRRTRSHSRNRREKHHHHRHHKSRHHKRSKSSPEKRERSVSSEISYRRHRGERKVEKSSRHYDELERRSRKSKHHHHHRYRSSSRDREKDAKSTTFIGEMLRNSRTKKVISRREKTDLMDSLVRKKTTREFEEGEVESDQNESYTPRFEPPPTPPEVSYTPPLVKDPEPEEIETNNNWIPLPEETHQKKKKKSVLDLPMPPIIFKKRTPRTPETPDLKPEHFKYRDTHFKEICQHLDVNPVVISPVESVEQNILQRKSRPRPTILNREVPPPDFPDRSFETFEIIEKIGEGTYGKVFKAKDLETKKVVALKFVRMEKESEGFPITGLREVKILRELHHPNIVQLREIVHEEGKSKKYEGTYLVFEYMNHDLMGLLDNESMVFDEPTIYRIIRQILEGLNYCHKRKILHRDLKCSNILVHNDGTVKLADFGLGRQWVCERPYTNKVISLWYRPIELLLGEEKYGTSVDIWSLGCIFGELFQRRTVFPFGTEVDMINAIFSLCGSPTKNSWAEVKFLPGYATLKPKVCRRVLRESFQSLLPPLALDLFDKMLCLNPAKRITAEEALESNWITFMDKTKLSMSLKLPAERDCHEMGAKLRRKKKTEYLLL